MNNSINDNENSRSQGRESSSLSKKLFKIIPVLLTLIGTYIAYMTYQDSKTSSDTLDKTSQDVQVFFEKYADQVLISFNTRQIGPVAKFIDPSSEYLNTMNEVIKNQEKFNNTFTTVKIHPVSKLEKINPTTYKIATNETYIFKNNKQETRKDNSTNRIYTLKIENNKITIMSFSPGESQPD
ncbi:hypothetical protein [Bacillus sp. 196mf]|uniref:TcaA NTF2-like domain-containing protein n=1 Tax=Bacillus TaxID=1386 RepID=UPI000D7D0A8D|nr:hypothetical protein [Bacillus sp. 196mf]MDA1771316.1 hypothetical protein [Bacillus cereus]MDA2092395.1 hypothetical protein [Bacillus cereus]PYE91344.1 hypothetical protein ATL10_10189 [Bacillus sp. 196mf]